MLTTNISYRLWRAWYRLQTATERRWIELKNR